MFGQGDNDSLRAAQVAESIHILILHDLADELRVESALLLFRSRGDTRPPEIVCAGRVDRLRRNGHSYLLAERRIDVDESVLRTQNLAIFL